MPAKRALIMHPLDNVATAVDEIQPGEQVSALLGRETLSLEAIEAIPFGFKIAIADIPTGDSIRKYGASIGTASVDIARGAMVHIHNLEGTRARGDLSGKGSK